MARQDIEAFNTLLPQKERKVWMNHMKQSCRGGLGGVRSVTAFIANIAVLPIMVIWPFGGSHRPTVEVHDEAGILRTEPLAKEI